MKPYSTIVDSRTVTAKTLDEHRAACVALDQRAELVPGCETWGIIYNGGQRGQMTRWPNGRGAVSYGGDSLWGDWGQVHGRGQYILYLDCGGTVNVYGEDITDD